MFSLIREYNSPFQFKRQIDKTTSILFNFDVGKFTQLLILAAVVTISENRSSDPANLAKSIYPHRTNNKFYQQFESYGSPFTYIGNTFPKSISFLPAYPAFSQTSENILRSRDVFSKTITSYTRTRENYPHPGDVVVGADFPPTNKKVPAVGENFLKINQNGRSNPGFPQTPPQTIVIDRRPSTTTSTPSPSPKTPATLVMPTNEMEDTLEQEWMAFKAAFNKTYSSLEEERQRREIFIENRNKVAKYNQDYGTGRNPFVQKLNQYADLLNHEFNMLVNGLNRTRMNMTVPERRPSSYVPSVNVGLPIHIDWREVGAVTPVKRQGRCGACYAFAAAGALEGQTFRRTRRLIELSTQNLIDCTKTYTNSGCAGGLMEFAYEYIKDNRGIDTESAYPYEGKEGPQCRYRSDGSGAQVTGYVVLDEGDEASLERAVATVGPIAVGIDAHPDSFQFYSSGVYFEPKCSSSIDQLNHAVLVVGYGVEPNGQQYWHIKNSYGPEWGIGGYMKIAKFSNNHCGIASYASYPLV